MILVDTSVWIEHLRSHSETLAGLLERGAVLAHPFVVGELALGQLRHRAVVLTALAALPRATVAAEHEILRFVELHGLFGRGIGYVDVHLIAATMLTADALLWTTDRRLNGVAEELGVAAGPF